MISDRWPELPVLGSADLPRLHDDALWPALLTLSERLPAEHVVIGGIMVYLHGAVAGRRPIRVTSDVDVLFNVEIQPSSLKEAVDVLAQLGYKVAPDSPIESTHRYLGPNGEQVDVLAPAGVKPPPNLETTPPGRTVPVYGGRQALLHRVVIKATHGGRTADIVVPDLARALAIKTAAYGDHARSRPAEAFNSRHLLDLAFLASVVEDPSDILEALGPVPPEGHLDQAAVLDDPAHAAWSGAGEDAEDARLTWDVLRHGYGAE
ncbi:hypothetical protein FHX81_2851 [Saccharothrix saharensis]|uniref:Nucleotidyltransferase AbiEii toxin of type IV toxin-antitoxin system n=1 Tax=Saccharothrix saharensis TaxID=571190 RepID=A0A543JCM3_9PSEU|nr:hypothetical protein [Saccharothrix saharensis]TQM80516.1 hypothetical protein FHX81_2851 [Saccharothrix saharensis]